MATKLTDDQLALIAWTVLGEAAGEGKEGMEAVAQVIKNRAESGRYPSDPAAVAIQKDARGVHQFSTWNTKRDGGNNPQKYSRNSKKFKEALAIVQAVMAGQVEDRTGGATHYYAAGIKKPYWFDSEAPEGEVRIGNHVFGARTTAVATPEKAVQRPIAPIGVQPFADIAGTKAPIPRPATERPGTSGLKTRTVTSVPVDRYGNPVSTIQQAANREAQRLRVIRQNENDRFGEAARIVITNAASATKESRYSATPRDLSGPEARTVTNNAASSSKEPRGGSTSLEAALQREAERRRQLLTTEGRIQQEREEQRLYQSSSSRTVPRAVTSGVVRTAGTYVNGQRLDQAGDVAMPRDYVPTIKPSQATLERALGTMPSFEDVRAFSTGVRYITPVYNDEPSSEPRLKPGPPGLEVAGEENLTTIAAQPKGPRGRGRPVKKASANIKQNDPTLEEIVTVTRPKPVVVKRAPVVVRRAGPTPAQIAAARRQQELARLEAQRKLATTITKPGGGGAYVAPAGSYIESIVGSGALVPAKLNTPRWTSKVDNDTSNPSWW